MAHLFRSLSVALFTLTFLVIAPVLHAETTPPDELVRRLATEVTSAVRSDPELQNPTSPKIADIVGRLIVPRFDFQRITQFAMGRNWAKATPQEQKDVVEQFSRLLTRTYSNAIASLKDLDVEVKGTKANSGPTDVTVKTQMIGRPQPVAIDYSLINSASGWKVYDVTVEGISLITAYRDEFGTLVSSSGVSGLIDALKKEEWRMTESSVTMMPEGPLTLATVNGVLSPLSSSRGKSFILDLSRAGPFDSSAIALIATLRRRAKNQDMTFSLKNIPASLRALAEIYDLETFIESCAK